MRHHVFISVTQLRSSDVIRSGFLDCSLLRNSIECDGAAAWRWSLPPGTFLDYRSGCIRSDQKAVTIALSGSFPLLAFIEESDYACATAQRRKSQAMRVNGRMEAMRKKRNKDTQLE